MAIIQVRPGLVKIKKGDEDARKKISNRPAKPRFTVTGVPKIVYAHELVSTPEEMATHQTPVVSLQYGSTALFCSKRGKKWWK